MTSPYPPSGAPTAGYTSPIPVRPARLADAVASEWTKIRSLRSTMWTLGTMVAVFFGIGTLVALIVRATDDGTFVEDEVLSLGFFGAVLSGICVITLGVLTITSEYSTGMIRTTMTACPSRARILTAKAIVYFVLVFAVTAVTTLLLGVVQVGILGGEPDGGQWLRSTLGVSLYLAFLGLLALGIGSMIRHSAGAITVMFGVVLLPLVLTIFMITFDALRGLSEWLVKYSIPSQLGALYDGSMMDGGPTGWEPLAIIVGLTAAALAGAYATLESRDV
ncbi:MULTISPECIES: ABC transporter permease subunit [Streptomyces]|uniref:ABC transporter permease n=1 Tax=Streptomyces tsukubensis (strain DSM 42081 / NBRC 108919 / NRRL 18488 / 9993) TaxID=1114943 RepID=I2N6B5_STRT9|nr:MULTISPECIES: ABC transporter permease subunit [Streptomyces]AZK96528.1 ABC transporter permease [Streptomyces tsukubensis]EIF92562.1 ABC transporter integral membrane protein [Streptomyces tsukubensis NRRL18488]MYS65878.1 ABC transporter permease subunit [Streptomyces sp. SID5473]QKM67469.1 ABC transporter permease [Streptomyces tsukubensis NRRL18488]TAI43863.1 ABC transporter permease [Streptomyces tsukubensis]